MASTSPPPESLPPPPAATSPPNQTTVSPPPTNPTASAPPPQSPAPPVSSSPPPSPPPAPRLPTSPPPSPPAAPPPSPPVSTPPPLPPVNATPPAAPTLSPPPPGRRSPPPQLPPTPPDTPPATPSPSPPPPQDVPSPPTSDSPPPPPNPPENPPPNQPLTPPPPNPPENPPPNQPLTPPPPNPPENPPPASLPPPNSPAPRTPSPPSSPNKPTGRSTNPSPNGTDTATSGGPSGGSNRGGAITIGLVVGFVLIGLLAMAVWYRRRQKRRRGPNVGYIMPSPSTSSVNSESLFLQSQKTAHLSATSPPGSNLIHSYSPEHGGAATSQVWFTYEELSRATNGFSGSNLLGEGGFGCVYKGVLEDGREVAVKQLKIGGGQGEREFRAEVEIISRVHHRHLVSLVGYCIHEHQRLLVYQYVPNDTLHYHLHGEGRPVMDWATRIKVAAGAARGLAYLHEDCHPRIIHRDIKSSNILLDNNFDAQVADFGLAKLAMDTDTHVTTRVMGTFGYMAPEYASSGKLTEKSDVFSFGVLLLELITGRKPVDASRPLGDESLVEWARPLLGQALENQRFEEVVDPRLGNDYVRQEMFRMMEAAAACIRHLAPKRPRMSQVVRALDSIVEFTTDLSNGMRPGQSQVFDSREQSAQIRLFQRMAFGSQKDISSEFFNDSRSSWRI